MAAIKFTVRRRPAVLVAPASPTPRELKRLSDFDDHDAARVQTRAIFFYERKESVTIKEDKGKDDPAVVIRDAVARALVPYYPLAGRLREHGGGKLAVDCTGEGVLFVEADADVRLEQFGGDAHALLPPFPCVEELIFDVPGSSAILHTPLLLIQVTRLACGGFILGLRLNHTMVDGLGLAQFLGAMAELSRGDAPTVRPVWERHLLEGRRNPHPPPQRKTHDVVNFWYAADDNNKDSGGSSSSSTMLQPPLSSLINNVQDDMVLRNFFFGPGEMAAIRDQLSPADDLLRKRVSRFDLIAGWLWKFRTMALAPPDSNQPMFMIFIVSVRRGIPIGYYGNTLVAPVAVSTAGELCANPVSYAVGLVKEAKEKVDMEYVRSLADLFALRRRQTPRITAGMYSLNDVTKARFDHLDLGWGRPLYGGPVEALVIPALPWASSYVFPFKNASGEDSAVVPVCLPRPAMDRLVHEMGKLKLSSTAGVATLQQQQPRLRRGFPSVVKRSAL